MKIQQDPNEASWLKLARQGDDEAFSCLVEIYQRPVYNLCNRMLGHDQEAEDAAQETFWRAYQALDRYDPERSFATWLLSIAAHYCIDLQRKRFLPSFSMDIAEEEFIQDHGPGPESTAIRSEEHKLLRESMESINPLDRAALILRYWYDLSDREISETLSLSVSAVKSRLHRARLALAKNWPDPATNPSRTERKKYESPAF